MSPQEREAAFLQKGGEKLEAKDGYKIRQRTDGELDILAAVDGNVVDGGETSKFLTATLSQAIADATGAGLPDVEILEVIVPEYSDATAAKRFLQHDDKILSRFGAKFAVKSDSPASSKRIEKTMMQPAFGDAVVSGWKSASGDSSKVELGGAVTRSIKTREVHEQDTNNSEDTSSSAKNLVEYKEDIEKNWQLIVAACIASALFICLFLYCCNCISCCGVATAKC